MSETQNPRSRGVSLNDLIWFIASRWRKILLFALIAAVLSGGVTAASYAVKLRSSEYLEAAKATNAQQKAAYQQNYDRLSALQKHLKTQLEYQAAYTSSPLFRMDPYAVHTVTTVYYASVDAEDVSPLAVLAAYGARFKEINAAEVLSSDGENGDYGLSSYFIQYTLTNPSSDATNSTISVMDVNTSTMTVIVIGETAEQADALQALVDRSVRDSQADIAAKVAPHRLEMLSRAATVSENAMLVQMHKEYESRMKTARELHSVFGTDRIFGRNLINRITS